MTDADARGSILSAPELAEMRAEHREVAGSCEACNEFWPCDASQLLVHVEAREQQWVELRQVDAAVHARALAQADAARLQLEKEVRQLLWLNHGHSSIAYGDDGEMQCNDTHQNGETHAIGPLDFKRQPLPLLASAICSLLRFEQRERAAQAERITHLETEFTTVRNRILSRRDLTSHRAAMTAYDFSIKLIDAALVASRSPAQEKP